MGRSSATPADWKACRSAVRRQECAVRSEEPVVRQAAAPRDVSAAQAGPRLGLGPREAAGRARVDDLGGPRVEVPPHGAEVGHQLGMEARREPTRRRPRLSRLDGPSLLPPLREAAVQHGHAIVPEHAEGPPDARGGDQVLARVHHDPVAVPDAEGAHRLGEARLAGQHVGKPLIVVGDRVDVEVDRPGDVGLAELRARVALEMRQVPRRVQDAERGIAQMLGQPRRAHDRAEARVRHVPSRL